MNAKRRENTTRRRGIVNTVLRAVTLSELSVRCTIKRNPKLLDDLQHFCLFIGHGRSGSSLVGALLNAHPNVVMSNELDVLTYLAKINRREQLFNMIYHFSNRQARRGSAGGGGYTYRVADQWQGRHQQIRVIGDRKAGATAIRLFRDPRLLDELEQIVQIPVRFVSVVRNPYDTLTTTLKKTFRQEGESERSHLIREIGHYFERASAIKHIIDTRGSRSIIFLHHEDLLVKTSDTLTQLLKFFDLNANDDYIEACVKIIRPTAHVTRTEIDWPQDLLDRVRQESARFFWLKDYSYASR